MKNINFFLFNAVLVCFFAGCSTPENKPMKSKQASMQSIEAVDPGKSLFDEKCMACHGADGTAGILNAANLKTSKLNTSAISRTITTGKNAMPAFADRLSPEEIKQLAGYVLKLRKRKTGK